MKKINLYCIIIFIGVFNQCYAQEFSYKVINEYVAEYDTNKEKLIVEYKGKEYSRSMDYDEKILSCKIKIIDNVAFFRTRIETYVVGTQGKPFYAHIMYILVPAKNNGLYFLELTFQEILKGWIEKENEPDQDKFEVKITGSKKGPILTLKNKDNKNDIQLVYFYDSEEERFLR